MAATGDVRMITASNVDKIVADLVADSASITRTRLSGILPTGGGGGTTALPAGLLTSAVQRDDGTWPNPVRPTGAHRIFWGVAGKPYPTTGNGLTAGDIYIGVGTIRRCLVATTPATWTELLTSGTSGGGVVITDPGTVSPTPTPDPTPTQPAPSMTVRPATLVASTGTWASTGTTSIVQALSDQSATGVTSAPSGTSSGGVSLRIAVPPLLMASGNDLIVTLWGAKSTTAGEVTVTVARNGTQIAAPITMPVTATSTSPEYRWRASDLPILGSWDGLTISIDRRNGGLDLADVTMQSVPPVSVVTPTDPGTASAATVFGGVFASQLSAAPRSIYTDDKRGYLTSAGAFQFGAYDDAPQVVVATQTDQRVKVTTTVAGGNTATGTGWADSVPIPSTVKPPSNRWKVMLVISPATDEAWEFVDMTKNATTGAWACTRGGKIAKMSTSKGLMPVGTGITGSGIALAAPRITLDEARRAVRGDAGAISHTLGLNLPDTAYASGYWTAPATRTDGQLSAATEEAARKQTPLAGDRVRLRKDFPTTNLTGLSLAIATALKTYGAVIVGGAASGKPTIIAESGETEQAASGIEPWGEILAGAGVDTLLSWLKAADLEFVPAGWLSTSTVVSESPMSTGGTVTPTPTNPTPTPDPVTGMRRPIKMWPGVTWMSGASCKAIESSTEGMGSAYATWRGEPCYMARCWADQGGNPSSSGDFYSVNDWSIASLDVHWKNWHASMDIGFGFFGKTENMANAARGNYDARWSATMKKARSWWASRRDPSICTVFMSPAHEMNGSWYPWSVNSSNYKQFIDAWKRLRAIQLRDFPECQLTFNANRDSSFYDRSAGKGMDWRNMVPGYSYGGGKISDWVDCGAVDYYNMDPNSKTLAEFNSHALQYDSYGGPKGIERHRQFWEAAGLPMTIPEWSNNKTQGDSPDYADGMNQFMRKNAGVGPGKVVADALFNMSTGSTYYSGEYAVYGDVVGSPKFAARYRALVWGK